MNHYNTVGHLNLTPTLVQSPCIKKCKIDPVDRICSGCYRTLEEITNWRTMSDDQKRQTLVQLIQRSKDALDSTKQPVQRGGVPSTP
jgi:hypothetical protein